MIPDSLSLTDSLSLFWLWDVCTLTFLVSCNRLCQAVAPPPVQECGEEVMWLQRAGDGRQETLDSLLLLGEGGGGDIVPLGYTNANRCSSPRKPSDSLTSSGLQRLRRGTSAVRPCAAPCSLKAALQRLNGPFIQQEAQKSLCGSKRVLGSILGSQCDDVTCGSPRWRNLRFWSCTS